MLFATLFFLLGLCITIYVSPIVIHYEKAERASLSLHFVFFSINLLKKDKAADESNEKEKPKENTKRKKGIKKNAILSAIRYAIPRTTVCVHSLPMLSLPSPFYTGIGLGAYYFLLSILLAPFGERSDTPLLRLQKQPSTTDIQFKFRFYTFLHTFLIYLAKYQTEKEAKKIHVRNKNE